MPQIPLLPCISKTHQKLFFLLCCKSQQMPLPGAQSARLKIVHPLSPFLHHYVYIQLFKTSAEDSMMTRKANLLWRTFPCPTFLPPTHHSPCHSLVSTPSHPWIGSSQDRQQAPLTKARGHFSVHCLSSRQHWTMNLTMAFTTFFLKTCLPLVAKTPPTYWSTSWFPYFSFPGGSFLSYSSLKCYHSSQFPLSFSHTL